MSSSFRYLTSTDKDQEQKQTLPELSCGSGDSNIIEATKAPVQVPSAGDNEENDEEEKVVDTSRTDEMSSDTFDQHLGSGGNDDSNSQQLSPGLSLLQAAAASSPPPHSYRHSRAYRHFKNPPQPHMCIRTTTEAGEELFINVLSWTRIVIPQEPSDPIPLYGGMRVPPGSPRSPPIVFAVMANPEVLKDSGRHSKDPEERRAMVELMCDFVEAMNPGVKLVRNAVILKDRDISGELKDVWNAVQAQRDREREEQIMQQRQQQHYHNLATNGGGATNLGVGLINSGLNNSSTTFDNHQQQQQQIFSKSGIGGNLMGDGTPPRSRKMLMQQETQMNEENISNMVHSGDLETTNHISLAMLAEKLDNKLALGGAGNDSTATENHREDMQILNNDVLCNGNDLKDSIDSISDDSGNNLQRNELNNQLNANNCGNANSKTILDGKTINGTGNQISSPLLSNGTTNSGIASNANNTDNNSTTTTTLAPTVTANISGNSTAGSNAKNPITSTTNITTATSNAVTVQTPANPTPPPTKKEKLGGFLPNGCIFPRFTKNNKHKDKDKESKPKDKEKNALLSALKKSKDKKSSQASSQALAVNLNQDDGKQQQQQQQKELNKTTNTSIPTTTTTTSSASSTSTTITANNSSTTNNHHQYSLTSSKKNCLQQLESEVQKLDLNRVEGNNTSSTKNSSSPSSSATTSNTTTNHTNNKSGVGVH
ncbi:uncharacterized protein LOC142234598 [Haematobia irritans]|uniref:uncharacterized protein LOC142234598 n=1 Tax=Haematobia irritans TaxID=7368 RepID=UPI003F4F5899